jgi:hypothetical protein
VTTQRLRHGRVELALHALRSGEGRPLLLLHGLGERSPRIPGPELADWRGPVFALDFMVLLLGRLGSRIFGLGFRL